MEATQAIETKLTQVNAFDSPIAGEHDIERMTKNVQGCTEVTLIRAQATVQEILW